MPIKVLVADDSPTIRRRAESTLADAGYEVTCVESGEAAWALIEAGDAGAILLCDILMPGMDGYELCRRVKTTPELQSMPVLLLRGTFEPWDQAKAESVGADGFITKPFDANVLLSTLGEVVAEMGASGAATGDEPADTTAEIHMPPPAVAAAAAAGATVEMPAMPLIAPISSPTTQTEPEWSPPKDEPRPPASAGPLDDVQPSPPSRPVPVAAPVAAAPADDDPFGFGDEPVASPPAPAENPLLSVRAPEPAAPPAPARTAPAPAPAMAPSPAPAPAPAMAVASSAAPVNAAALEADEAFLDRLADKLVARISTKQVEKIAWEVVPDVAEALIRRRILDIESKLAEE